MSYKEIHGNLFNSNAQALINTVNCVGAMGKGIALEFRRRYPQMFQAYHQDCLEKRLVPGRIYYYRVAERLIMNFAIKDDWKYPSKLEWIESCLYQFAADYKKEEIQSVAFPWMGAMNGRLPLDIIQSTMRKYLENLDEIDIEVYSFDPNASDPLFEVLRSIAQSKDPYSFEKQSGLRRHAYTKVIEAVGQEKINSFSAISESKLIGSLSLDKLYSFLTTWPGKSEPISDDNSPRKMKQPSLFQL